MNDRPSFLRQTFSLRRSIRSWGKVWFGRNTINVFKMLVRVKLPQNICKPSSSSSYFIASSSRTTAVGTSSSWSPWTSSSTRAALSRTEGPTVLPTKIWSFPMFLTTLGVEVYANGGDIVSFETVFPSASKSTGYTVPSFRKIKNVFSSTKIDREPSKTSFRVGSAESVEASLMRDNHPFMGRTIRREDWSTYMMALLVMMTTPPSDIGHGRRYIESCGRFSTKVRIG